MDCSTIGIVVKDDHNNLLFHENKFFIEASISKEDDLKALVKNKIEKIIGEKTFRLDKVSKKFPKLSISNNNGVEEEVLTMYMANIVTYNLNSEFKKEDEILENMRTSTHKDYFLKYFIRYDKYNSLVQSYWSMFFSLLLLSTLLDFPFKIRLNLPFDNFWVITFLFAVIPFFILHMLIIPSIVKYLINFHISSKIFKISNWLYWIIFVVYMVLLFKYT